jgi:hypothetical protein
MTLMNAAMLPALCVDPSAATKCPDGKCDATPTELLKPAGSALVSQVIVRRRQEFVASARLLGASHFRVIRRRVLPNVISTVILRASLDLGLTMLTEGSLSFLGLGVQPPNRPWAGISAESRGLVVTV